MRLKLISTLLTVTLTNPVLAKASQDYRTFLLPSQCDPDQACRCLSKDSIHTLAVKLRDYDGCLLELRSSKNLINQLSLDNKPALAWWQEPAVVGGGVVVGFLLGAIASYSLRNR